VTALGDKDTIPLVTPPPWKGATLKGISLGVMAAMIPDLRQMATLMGVRPEGGVPLFTSRFYASAGPWAMAGPFIGAPLAVMIVETLVGWGIRNLLFVGWCGAIDPEVNVGDVILPTAGISGDGTSRHYAADDPSASRPSAHLAGGLAAALTRGGMTVHQGPVGSTDAIFKETPRLIDGFRNRGAIGVDMEVSAVLTAGRFLGARVAAVLLVSDRVSGEHWQPGFKTTRFREARLRLFPLLINLCETTWKTIPDGA
jgi:purine-nucleoside phosphorylase